MKELNFYQKYKLKYTDRDAYVSYKYLLKYHKMQLQLKEVAPPQFDMPKKDLYSFKHSGNSGDIIYALPTMLGLAGNAGCSLHLNLEQPATFEKHFVHPLGNVMLNAKMFELLKPLFLYQSYIKELVEFKGQPIDYDLDKFREYPISLDKGNIARWSMLVYPVAYDLNNVWIKAPAENGLKESIVLARSSRYNAPGINHGFLKRYASIYFVGTEDEFKEMKKQISHLQYLPVKNFLELASYIAGAKLFIGNQSFPFSLAEAMKVNRLLEMYYMAPNVNVYGTNGFDFCFQPQFEYLVKLRYDNL